MNSQRALVSGALLALLLGACGASPSPVPTATPPAATATRPSASSERCAGLHWYDVRDAVAAADHYTYRSTDHIVYDSSVPGPSSVATDRTVAGAYQAPDRAREISEWAAGTVLTPGMYPDFILIGDLEWLRVLDGTGLWHASPGRLSLTPEGGALDDLFAGLQAKASWSTGKPDPAAPTECVFTITSAVTDDGRRWDASLWAGATTLLPTRLLRREVAGETGNISTFDMTIDPTGQAAIEPPPADEIALETPRP